MLASVPSQSDHLGSLVELTSPARASIAETVEPGPRL
jgi:hypothetical protein